MIKTLESIDRKMYSLKVVHFTYDQSENVIVQASNVKELLIELFHVKYFDIY